MNSQWNATADHSQHNARVGSCHRASAKRILVAVGLLAVLAGGPATQVALGQDKKTREYLEHFSLEELLLERTEQVQGRWIGHIIDPNEMRHTVVPGSYIGRHDGRVLAINAEGLRILEIVPDNLGGWRENEISLRNGIRYEEPRVALVRKYAPPINTMPIQSQFVDAAGRGDIASLSSFLEQGANLDAIADPGANTALYAAVLEGKIFAVAWLIGRGAQVDSFVRAQQETPLILSAMLGHTAIAELLLEAGADPNLSDVNGRIALSYPSAEGDVETTNLLLEHGANPTLWNKYGVSPVTSAAANGQLEIVKRFRAAGVPLETRDRIEHTMLAAAGSEGQAEVARYLVESGADINATNLDGETVLDLAVRRGHKDLAAFLKTKGARPAIAPELIGYWANVEASYENWWIIEADSVVNYGGRTASGKCLESFASIKGPNRIEIRFGNKGIVDMSLSGGLLAFKDSRGTAYHKRVDKNAVCRNADGSYDEGAPHPNE